MARVSASFDEFVATSADGLLRTAFLITSDTQEAEDLVQESLLEVSRRWSRVGRMDQPLSYTRRVLINQAIRGSEPRLRRQSELDAEFGDTGSLSADIERLPARDELRTALRQLTPRQRAVLVLRYFNDLTEPQVAELLGCSTGNVKSTTSRSLAHLRELMEPTPLHVRSNQR